MLCIGKGEVWIVAVQYARRTAVTDIKDVDGARQYIPLKLNASGVMPIIFAQAIMFLPVALGQKFPALISWGLSSVIAIFTYLEVFQLTHAYFIDSFLLGGIIYVLLKRREILNS